jgi:hypothetical protein
MTTPVSPYNHEVAVNVLSTIDKKEESRKNKLKIVEDETNDDECEHTLNTNRSKIRGLKELITEKDAFEVQSRNELFK